MENMIYADFELTFPSGKTSVRIRRALQREIQLWSEVEDLLRGSNDGRLSVRYGMRSSL